MKTSVSFNIGSILVLGYGSPIISLEQILKDFFPHLTIASANRRAAKQSLPFPVFKAEASQKAPYLVNLFDFARYLEEESHKSKLDWQNMHS
ncbi:pyocin activator protein PrtN [Alkanindiges hydrocarboniclasticus]|uniref:Pyocin activator protein PrtN n=1 Tax=Alkanindiges hydrocarboniclasticus TaxID=1907941 RepID=A0A1S8CXP0_9GAMM|nr:pyocin activator PrtN family protein [Alkanindiges hydrocarboniclasticus]ONG41805.1 pyocin activator protein PrtN [Alkanindiges hydrocarboniclasticus]